MKTIFKKTIAVLSTAILTSNLAYPQTWTKVGTGTNSLNANDKINALTIDPSGNIYAAGVFYDNTSGWGPRYVAKWDGTNWTKFAVAGENVAEITALTSDAHGHIYFGYSNGLIKMWDGISFTEFTNIGYPGVGGFFFQNACIYTLISDTSGNVYASGKNENTNQYFVAKWDGTMWSALGGTTGPNALNANSYVRALAIDGLGNVFAGGDFKDNSNYTYVAKWDGNNWTELGTGTNALNAFQIFGLTVDKSNNLYVKAENFVSKWTNNGWTKLGNPQTNPITGNSICTDPLGNLYAFGTSSAGNKVQKWDGTSWSTLGMENGGDYIFSRQIEDIISDSVGNIYVGGDFRDSTGNRFVAKYDHSQPTKINQVNNIDLDLRIYPNPSTNNIFIQLNQTHPALKISILNTLGQIVGKYDVPFNGLKTPFKIDIETLTDNLYILQVTGANINLSRKFEKE